MIRADKIRGMSVADMAAWMEKYVECQSDDCPAYGFCEGGENCRVAWLAWLNQEVKECQFCKNHEKGSTLCEIRQEDGEPKLFFVSAQNCPLCGKELRG